MAIKIFLSHSSVDEVLASALVNCLFSSMVLEDGDLRCTSVPGHKLIVGSDFSSTLLDDIDDSSVVIGLITKQALASSWVLFELGATWGSRKNLKPLITDEVNLKELPGPISSRHVARLSSRSDMTQFLDEVTKLIGAKPRTPAKIDQAIETFLSLYKEYEASRAELPVKAKVETKIKEKEPSFAGVPFSELKTILRKEIINIPAKFAGEEKDAEISLFDLFVGNASSLSDGLQSNWDADSAGAFLYRACARATRSPRCRGIANPWKSAGRGEPCPRRRRGSSRRMMLMRCARYRHSTKIRESAVAMLDTNQVLQYKLHAMVRETTHAKPEQRKLS